MKLKIFFIALFLSFLYFNSTKKKIIKLGCKSWIIVFENDPEKIEYETTDTLDLVRYSDQANNEQVLIPMCCCPKNTKTNEQYIQELIEEVNFLKARVQNLEQRISLTNLKTEIS